MHTILGAGGIIGREVAGALGDQGGKIRLVSRNPKRVNPNDEIISGDLLNDKSVNEAVAGSSVVYLTVGLPYSVKIWREQWPVIMTNVINACQKHDAKLVFFDNIYMYDEKHMSRITEETPINPPSEKGKVRAEIARQLMNAVEKGKITALIARAADFYGPQNSTSVLIETVFKNLKNGKKANWLASADFKHSFTYTPDAGKATAMLGSGKDGWNQVWHLPTAENPPTGREWIEAFAREMDVPAKIQVAGPLMVKLIGLFNPIMRELKEMLYQYDRDYYFDSGKFIRHFNFEPTPYLRGIKTIVEREYR